MSSSGATIEATALRFEFEAGPRGRGFRLETPPIELESGASLVCMGPSGSGKSTFLSLIGGLLEPSSGKISVDGEDWATLTEAERRRRRLNRIGFVFQDFGLLEHLSVRDNILLPRTLAGSVSDLDQCVVSLARKAGLYELLDRLPAQLSQGEKQRVAVCRALAQRPALLLADEPTGNLDQETTRVIGELLTSEAESRGMTVVVVTHDDKLAARFGHVIDFAQFAGATT